MTKQMFRHAMHDDTLDGFDVEVDFKKQVFVHIRQEMDSGVVRKVYLSADDIKQMYAEVVRAEADILANK